MLGYSTSCQYIGQVLGPLTGGYLGGHFGMPVVFVVTCMLMAGCALGMLMMRPGIAASH
jgi:MFS family permease